MLRTMSLFPDLRAVLFAVALVSVESCAQSPLPAEEAARVEAVSRLMAAAVQVRTGAEGAGRPGSEVASSGFFWDDRGHIVTAASWLSQGAPTPPSIVVRDQAGRVHRATLVGIDPLTEVAVLRIAAATAGAPLPRGTASDLLPGRDLFAVGHPFGLHHTLIEGRVSGQDRVLAGEGRVFAGMLQTTLPVNPGDAGAPVSNSRGALVGLVFSTYGRSPEAMTERVEEQLSFLEQNREAVKSLSREGRKWWMTVFGGVDEEGVTDDEEGAEEAIDQWFDGIGEALEGVRSYGLGFLGKDMDFLGAQGISFVLPVEQVDWIVEQILEHGTVRRGELGLVLTAERGGRGVHVFEVDAESAAAVAGITRGDRIVSVAGEPLEAPEHLLERLMTVRAGELLRLGIVRAGASADAPVEAIEITLNGITEDD